MKEGLVGCSPFDYSRVSGTVELYKRPSQEPDTYTEGEYSALLTAATKIGDQLVHDLIIVFAGTGLRFGEAAKLTPDALHWDDDPYVDIRARNGWTPKDADEIKQVPMSKKVAEILQRREEDSVGGYLFANGCGNPIAANKTRERLQQLFPSVGIERSRRLHWHSWRNFFIRRCVDAGIPVDYIMLWTGHDSATMVLRYLRAKRIDRIGAHEFRKMQTVG
jgi:integrase